MKGIPYGKQQISKEDIKAVVSVLESDFLTQGPKIPEFERAFADYVGSRYAVAVSNGTAALHLSVLALGLQPGERVITTPITFAASANCVLYAGGIVDFVDIDPNTYLMDLDKLTEKLQSKPLGYYTGVIPVDFAGYPVDLEKLKDICKEFDLWIIEDACHAPGGNFVDQQGVLQQCGNGAFADLSIFSFHPVKHIATGEGGMITTNDQELYQKILRLRTHGITKDPSLLEENHGAWYYEMQELGFNYRLTDIQAALGSSQLLRARSGLIRRREIASKYDQAFCDNEIIKVPLVSDDVGHAYHLYVIQVEDRPGLYNYLRENHIYAQVHYIPVHTLPYYRSLGWKRDDFPKSITYYQNCLSLPIFPSLLQEEVEFVIDKVNAFCYSN